MTKPAQTLYHGTVLDYANAIEEQGLRPINHDKVYLTTDIQVAYDYAKRKTNNLNTNSFQPVICIIDSLQMIKDGFVFNHDVSTAEWTTDTVPSRYILQVVIESEDDLQLIATQCKNLYEELR